MPPCAGALGAGALGAGALGLPEAADGFGPVLAGAAGARRFGCRRRKECPNPDAHRLPCAAARLAAGLLRVHEVGHP